MKTTRIYAMLALLLMAGSGMLMAQDVYEMEEFIVSDDLVVLMNYS